ncbi:phosphoadenylyl-sulfate reductase [Oleisolibacter albus]|uniref:phosphoadenylyl-sulfate reductase n=1 Tax=Oleisolibacter albus TaxID=2171757 RepID=UPI000DF30D5C|nr:phosphoadenylyl-sulfate reductase [Oleisolibacter albus]
MTPQQLLAADLNDRYGQVQGPALLRLLLTEVFPGRLALVSSFGTESAVLLHMLAQADPAAPVLFINTGKLFGETQRYRRQLVERLGLTGVREIGPESGEEKAEDAAGDLWLRHADACCALRKVRPLARALAPYAAWITGRKRYQASTRAALPLFEADGAHVKVNPLASWTRDQIEAYLDSHGLPRHPLQADGYPSVGCMPCTDRVAAGEDVRAGRWRGQAKTECGIHRPHPAPAGL